MMDKWGELFWTTFAGTLHDRLAEPKSFGQYRPGLKSSFVYWRVAGSLALQEHGENGSTLAKLSIHVHPQWLQVPPRVTVREEYLRREEDWHASKDGAICYVLDKAWADWLTQYFWSTGADCDRAVDAASTWCLASVDSLVSRHLLAHRHRIDKWPKDWPDYSHRELGVQEYLRAKKSRGVSA